MFFSCSLAHVTDLLILREVLRVEELVSLLFPLFFYELEISESIGNKYGAFGSFPCCYHAGDQSAAYD